MTDRRYTDDEVAAIFATASEATEPPRLAAPRDQGLTLAQLQEIGGEVGISADAVARAARALDGRRPVPAQRFLGFPIGVERAVTLYRWLSDQEWEQLVVELREVFNAKGTVRSYGSLREWTNGNLQALLEPTPTGHRVRLRTVKGSARTYMMAGLFLVGVGGAITAASALGGHVANAVSGVGFLVLMGIGVFANAALRLPRWARLRARQMEAIAEGLALPPGTPPQSSPPTAER